MGSDVWNFTNSEKVVNADIFDCVISLGSKCGTATLLNELGLRKKSFPFDFIPTSPDLILKYLIDDSEMYPSKNEHNRSEREFLVNADGVWFGHFNLSDGYTETISKFKQRRCDLIDYFHSKKSILFVYAAESDIYNEMNNSNKPNHENIQHLVKYIKSLNTNLFFHIIAIHVNKQFPDSECISNYTIIVPEKYISKNMETHVPDVCYKFRDTVKTLLRKILNINHQI
tara:strand:+ start:5541 stop:6224 length:684 start_codon:yes stop_codon:yes gene_type:complete